MAAELRHFTEEEHAVLSSRHVARHRHVAPTNQANDRDGLEGLSGSPLLGALGRSLGMPRSVAEPSDGETVLRLNYLN
jgi:hypothetical protein